MFENISAWISVAMLLYAAAIMDHDGVLGAAATVAGVIVGIVTVAFMWDKRRREIAQRAADEERAARAVELEARRERRRWLDKI